MTYRFGRFIIHFLKETDPDDFDQRYRPYPQLWKQGFHDIVSAQGLSFETFEPYPDGSNLVAAVGGKWVVKVFPPFHRHQWESDHRIIQHLDQKLSLATPHHVNSGELAHGWTFIIMSKLPGKTLDSFWPTIDDVHKSRILEYIGQIIAQVHKLPTAGLETLQPQWDEFLEAQVHGAKARHTRLGMPAWFIDQFDDFLQKSLNILPRVTKPVLLTGEYTPFNLLASKAPGPVSLTGMIDFGDAMLGDAAYDLLGPSLFLAEGKLPLIQSLMSGYGESWTRHGMILRRRLMLLQILHRFSNFKAQLRIPDWEQKAGSIVELENLIWPLVADHE